MLSNYKLQMAKVKTKVDSSFETQGLLGETGLTRKIRISGELASLQEVSPLPILHVISSSHPD